MFFGDVVGRTGRLAFTHHLPELKARYRPDFVVVNGENAAGGFGITEDICEEFLASGADAITLGNHAFAQREALVFIERVPQLLRPVNYPPGTPGRGSNLFKTPSGRQVLVMNIMGRIMMDPLDDPFAALERELEACPLGIGADAIIVDIHAEATSEKMAIGHAADGRASLVVGTHTHVPTADHQIFSGGTAYLTDAGMCGDFDSVIGMDKVEPLTRFQRRISGGRMEPAEGEATVCGVMVDTDDATGLALSIAPIRVGGRLQPALPGA
jgi:hypothetical protein